MTRYAQHIINMSFLLILSLPRFYAQNSEIIEQKECQPFNNSQKLLCKQNNKWGVMNKNGEVILNPIYDTIVYPIMNSFDFNKYIVKQDGLFGIIEDSGELIAKPQYNKISNWIEDGPSGHYVVKNSKFGLISKEGLQILPLIYENIYYISDSIIIAELNQKIGIIDIGNEETLPFKYKDFKIDYMSAENPPNFSNTIFLFRDEKDQIHIYDSKLNKIIAKDLNNLAIQYQNQTLNGRAYFDYIRESMIK